MALRNSQVVIETLETESDPQLRNSQVVVETLETESDPTTRVSQVAVEIFEGIVVRYGFLGNDDDLPDAASWIILEGTPNIQSNKLELLVDSTTTKEKVKLKKKITGDFALVLNPKNITSPNATTWKWGIRLQISSTKYFQFGSEYYASSRRAVIRTANGGGESVISDVIPAETMTKIVIKKVGNVLRAWFFGNISDYKEVGTGSTVGLSNDEFSIYLFHETTDSEPTSRVLIDELAVVRGDLVNFAPKVMSVNIIT